jgi:hypothetical protein
MPQAGALRASIAAALDKGSFKEAGLEARKLVADQIKVAIVADDTKALRQAASAKKSLDLIFDKDIKQKVTVDTSSLGSKLKTVKNLLTGELDTTGKSAAAKLGAALTGGVSKAFSGLGSVLLKSGGVLAAVTTVSHTIPPILAAAGVLAGGALAVGIGASLIVATVKLNPKVSKAAKSLGSSFSKAFVAASNSGGKSSFADTLINSFNRLRSQAIPPLQKAITTLMAAFNNSGAIQAITGRIIQLSKWLGNGGMAATIALAVKAFHALEGEAGKAAGPLGSLTHAFVVLWPAIKAIWSIGTSVSSTLGKALLPAISKILPSLSRLAATVANAGAQLARTLAPALTWAAQALVPLIQDVATFVSKNPALVKAILGAALAWKAVTIAMDLTPFGAIVTAVVIMAAIIVKYHVQIKNAIVTAWQTVDRDAIHPVVSWFTNTIPHAFGVSLNAIESVLSSIKGAFVTAWHAIYNTTMAVWGSITKFFGGVWSGLKGGFSDVVGGITSTWGKLKHAFEDPISFAVNTVYNKGVVPLWNDTLAHLGLPKAHTLSLGFATGGLLDGPGTGISDSIPIQASRGEYIVRAPAVRKIGVKALDAMNGNSNSSHGNYSGGGSVVPVSPYGGGGGQVETTNSKGQLNAPSLGTDLLEKVKQLGGAALESALKPLVNSIPHNKAVSAAGSGQGNAFGNIAYDVGTKLISSIASAVSPQKTGGAPGAGGIASGSSFSNLLAAAKYFISAGATKQAAAGIASVIDGESGGNPEAVGTGGFGLIGFRQPVTEPVLTPFGYREMGTIKPGDYVIGSDGKPTEVLAVYPSKDADILEIRFTDGAWTRATIEHLWSVITGDVQKVITTGELTAGMEIPVLPGDEPRFVAGVRELGYTEDCQCIRVAADDSLYVTRDRIVTHNTPPQTANLYNPGTWPLSGNPTKDLQKQLVATVNYGKRNGPWSSLIKMTDVQAAADEWSASFERPAVHLSDTRPSVAAQLLDALGGGSGSSKSPATGGRRSVTSFFGGGRVPGAPAADQFPFYASGGEKIIPRAQVQSEGNKSGPTVEDLLAQVIARLDKGNSYAGQTASATVNTAAATGGLSKVRKAF